MQLNPLPIPSIIQENKVHEYIIAPFVKKPLAVQFAKLKILKRGLSHILNENQNKLISI